MADIFEEVEEGLRQDRLSGLWKRYGILAYLAAAVLIGGVGLNEYLKVQSAQTTTQNAARLEAALNEVEARNYEAAATQLGNIIAEEIAPSTVAAHYLAGVRLDGNGDAIAAADVLADAAGEVTDPTEQLALIKSAYLRADTSTRSELETFLEPLAEDTGAFGALAKELLAAKALQEGDVAFARREFSFLKVAPNVPPGVQTRAGQALDALPPVEDPMLEAPADTEMVEPETDTDDAALEELTDEPTEEAPE